MLQSLNYAPSADLAPFVKQHFVFRAPLPADFTLIDQLVSETAVIRVLLGGDWAAEYVPGNWRVAGPSILFGANSKCFRVRVKGPFTVVGVALRPSGWLGLFSEKASQYADDMWSLGALWGDDLADRLYHELVAAGDNDRAMVAVIEDIVRARLNRLGSYATDPEMRAFEDIARDDSTMRVGDAAATIGLSERVMERRCRATFGLTPKAILRRSRFLDMAAVFRGISDPGADERAALRFSDQSHLNREFRHFIDMTPGVFEKASTPLLDAVLKLREDGLN